MRRADAIHILPRPTGKTELEYMSGINQNIITVLHSNLPRAVRQTREISQHFKGVSELETARKIWDFLKKEIKYKRDREGYQDIKLPGRFVAEGSGDCKSYSLFTAGILSNLGIPYRFRYTSYSSDPTPQHVYIVTESGIIIDAVWNAFNSQKNFTHKKDYPMQISTLSGIGCTNCKPGNIGGTVMLGDAPIGFLKKARAAVKKTASKVQDKVKNTGVVKKAAKIQTAAKNTGVIKKASQIQTAAKNTGIIKKASQIQNKLKSQTGKSIILAGPRRAYRTLIAVNFRGWATKLASNKAAARQTWEKAGGSWSELDKSIEIGVKRKALFGQKTQQIRTVDGIGEVTLATVGTLLALAAPLIALFKGLTKDDGGIVTEGEGTGAGTGDGSAPDAGNMVTDIIDKVVDVIKSTTGDGSTKTDNATSQSQTTTDQPSETATGGSSNTGLYLLAAAAGAYFIFK